LDYAYYKSRIESMQSNNAIDVAEDLWLYRNNPVSIDKIADGMDARLVHNAISTLRRFHGFIIKVKTIGSTTLVQLLGFDYDLSGDEKPNKRTEIDLCALQNKLANRVFPNEV
jgi:hypothetical protein